MMFGIVFLYTLLSTIIIFIIYSVIKKYKKEIIDFLNTFKKKLLKNIHKILNIFLLFYFIIYFFIDSKFINKSLKIIFFNDKSIENFKKYYLEFIKYVLGYIILVIVLKIIHKIILLVRRSQKRNNIIKEKYIDVDKEDDNYEKNKILYRDMYKYFINENDNTPILITGEWGAGKTYCINYFFDNYFKYENIKVYKISCFGVTTREDLMNRLEKICKNADDGLFNKCMELIKKIPIVGEFLKSVLEKKYDINNIKKGSIFIFDNFERIGCIDKKANESNKYDLELKYNIISGIINELIENYKMKVIIVCNENEMLANYVSETFIYKLECKKFHINPNVDILNKIWGEMMKLEVDTKEYEEKFKEIYKNIEKATNKIFEEFGKKNVRILRSSIYSFIEILLVLYKGGYDFSKNDYEEYSIFYTILLINILPLSFRRILEYTEPFEKCCDFDGLNVYTFWEDMKGYYLAEEDNIDLWTSLSKIDVELPKFIEDTLVKIEEKKDETNNNK